MIQPPSFNLSLPLADGVDPNALRSSHSFDASLSPSHRAAAAPCHATLSPSHSTPPPSSNSAALPPPFASTPPLGVRLATPPQKRESLLQALIGRFSYSSSSPPSGLPSSSSASSLSTSNSAGRTSPALAPYTLSPAPPSTYDILIPFSEQFAVWSVVSNRIAWVPDQSLGYCMRCKADFTFFQRRHHCRQCGYLVCSDCSTHRGYARGYNTPQRVCNHCHSSLKKVTLIRTSIAGHTTSFNAALSDNELIRSSTVTDLFRDKRSLTTWDERGSIFNNGNTPPLSNTSINNNNSSSSARKNSSPIVASSASPVSVSVPPNTVATLREKFNRLSEEKNSPRALPVSASFSPSSSSVLAHARAFAKNQSPHHSSLANSSSLSSPTNFSPTRNATNPSPLSHSSPIKKVSIEKENTSNNSINNSSSSSSSIDIHRKASSPSSHQPSPIHASTNSSTPKHSTTNDTTTNTNTTTNNNNNNNTADISIHITPPTTPTNGNAVALSGASPPTRMVSRLIAASGGARMAALSAITSTDSSSSSLSSSIKSSHPTKGLDTVIKLSASDLFNRLSGFGSLLVLDSRSSDDYINSHVPRSINVPVSITDISASLTLDKLEAKISLADRRTFKLRQRANIVIIGQVGKDITSTTINDLYAEETKYLANLLLTEGRILSIAIIIGGFESFHQKYPFVCCGYNNREKASGKHIHRPPFPWYPNEIIDNFLYLGSHVDAKNAKHLKELGVTHVLNVTSELETSHNDLFKAVRICIDDDDKLDLVLYFEKAIEFIELCKKNNGRILVHCHQGISRSASMVLAYLMTKHQMTLKEAYDIVKARRKQIMPNPGFWRHLGKLELSLFPDKPSTLSACVDVDAAQKELDLKRKAAAEAALQKKEAGEEDDDEDDGREESVIPLKGDGPRTVIIDDDDDDYSITNANYNAKCVGKDDDEENDSQLSQIRKDREEDEDDEFPTDDHSSKKQSSNDNNSNNNNSELPRSVSSLSPSSKRGGISGGIGGGRVRQWASMRAPLSRAWKGSKANDE